MVRSAKAASGDTPSMAMKVTDTDDLQRGLRDGVRRTPSARPGHETARGLARGGRVRRPLAPQRARRAGADLQRPGLVVLRYDRPERVGMDLNHPPNFDEAGRPVGVLAIVVDSTERMLTSRRLVEDRERFAALFEQAPTFTAVLRGPTIASSSRTPAATGLSAPRRPSARPRRGLARRGRERLSRAPRRGLSQRSRFLGPWGPLLAEIVRALTSRPAAAPACDIVAR